MLVGIPSLLLVGALASAPGISEVVHTRTSTATFTPTHELRLSDGRIWWRPRSQVASALEPWALLPPDGVPAPRWRLAAARQKLGLRGAVRAGRFETPAALVAIAADGDDLIAVDGNRRVFHTRLSAIEWHDRFGEGALAAPLKIPSGAVVAVSRRTQPYSDIDGNAHPTDLPVTTVYALSGDGSHLWFADARRAPRLDGELCLPERGTVRARGMGASASTLAVLDDAGRVFTRLADYDSLGNDPVAYYSWRRERRSGARAEVRSLPPEGWRAQPPLPGAFTREITVVNRGRDAGGRELRVPGDGGYWTKALTDEAWRFVTTGVRRADAREASAAVPRAARLELSLPGAIWQGATTRLEHFDPLCPPAQVIVERDGERVALELWMRENLAALPRGRELSGALMFPASARGALANDVRALLGDTLVEVKIDVEPKRVTVRSANQTRSEPRLTFTRR